VTDAELQALVRQVLWAAFGLGVMFGAIAQRTHYCSMGALADVVGFGDWSRLRMWALAGGVAMLGFNAMVAVGWVKAGSTIYAGPALTWLSQLVGGLMFGFGMVLASGCGAKTLVRVGAGNLKSLVVLCVLGLTAFMTLRGLTAVWRAGALDTVRWVLPVGQDLPSLAAYAFGGTAAQHAPWLGGLAGAALLAWALRRPDGRSRDVLLGGLGTGTLVVALWWVSGRLGHVLEHPLTLEEAYAATQSGRMESFSFVAPSAHLIDWLVFYSDNSKALTLGVAVVLGVVVGSAAIALGSGNFRWEGFAGVEDTANHLIGAALMGIGGITAGGCTIGQGLSGASTLSLGSFIAVAGIVAGAWLALRWQLRRMARSA